MNIYQKITYLLLTLVWLVCMPTDAQAFDHALSPDDCQGWKLVWHDEFNKNGKLDPNTWSFEDGFVRNQEAQWYQKQNATCRNGCLIIEARKEKTGRRNPGYHSQSDDWTRQRQNIDYTSSSLTTKGKKEFLYGRFEIRAKIPVSEGAWPSIWFLGKDQEWPDCGEIDMMEFYRIQGVPHILANAGWGGEKKNTAKWNTKAVAYSHFTDRDPYWADKFHVWRMDWDEHDIRLYVDSELINEIPLDQTVNGRQAKGAHPFRQPMYLMLSLALGGKHGGAINDANTPMRYLIDYVRVYERDTSTMPTEWAQKSSHGYRVADEGAWCWFADPRALHYENRDINKTYIGYIDVHGNIKAMQYDFIAKKQEEVLVRSCFQPDDHDNPTFLALPDGRIMIFYSRHTDEPCFYYRISRKPGDITTLGEEKVIRTKDNTTYPSPFILSDDPDHFYLCWRGINWHPTIARISLPDTHDNVSVTDGPYQMIQSTGARPYAKYASNGKDRIYLTYTTGHPDNEIPNYLYFNYVDINTMRLTDVNGTPLCDLKKGPLNVSKQSDYTERYPLTVVDAPDERDWVFQVAYDKKGYPVIAMVRISADKESHDYYYVRWNGRKWKHTFIGNAGGHFHQSPQLEMCYSAGMAIDPSDVNIVYCSKPAFGEHGRVHELFRCVIGDDGNVIMEEQLTKDSPKNNVRPYVVQGSGGSPLRLTWMQGDYYDWIVSKVHPQGYPTAIQSDFIGFHSSSDVNDTDADHESIRPDSKGNLPSFNPKKDFTLTAHLDLDENDYGGCLIKMGKLSYWLDGKTLKPEVRYKGKTWRSTNRMATTDSWASQPRSTDGRWYAPVKLKHVQLRLRYDASEGTLSVYLNGLLDQRVRIVHHSHAE